MASSDSDRDRKPSSAQDSPGNPFIRFRRFADTQISSVLQSVIGLPSAISKSFDGTNQQRKSPFDDLKEGEYSGENQCAGSQESGSGFPDVQDDGDGVPATNLQRWSAISSPPRPPIKPGASGNKQARDDIDLYSPVIKSLFAHLDRTVDDFVNANRGTTGADIMCDVRRLFQSHESCGSPNSLNMIQSIMHSVLDTTSQGSGYRLLHSEKTLLPYILFSPYSPLALSPFPSPRQARALHLSSRDHFPYCNAFTDLLLASRGRDMCSREPLSKSSQDITDTLNESILGGRFGRVGDHDENPQTPSNRCDGEIRAYDGVSWIKDLHDLGLLRTDQSRWKKVDPQLDWPTRSLTKVTTPALEMSRDTPTSQSSMPTEGAQTEQDMYNHILEIASTSPDNTTDELGFLIAEARKFAIEQSKRLSQDYDSILRDPVKTASAIFDNPESFLDRDSFENRADRKSAGTQTVPSSQSYKEIKYQDVIRQKEIQSEPDDISEANRVVSTIKTIERVMLEDWSVQTTIRTERVFGDGKSVTETTHNHTPSPWAGDGSRHWFGDEDQYDVAHKDRCLGTKPRDRGNEEGRMDNKGDNSGKKNGWFWK